MRELTLDELCFVSGGNSEPGVCTPDNVNEYLGGIKDTNSVGKELINIYEGLVEATSHIIERVANAL